MRKFRGWKSLPPPVAHHDVVYAHSKDPRRATLPSPMCGFVVAVLFLIFVFVLAFSSLRRHDVLTLGISFCHLSLLGSSQLNSRFVLFPNPPKSRPPIPSPVSSQSLRAHLLLHTVGEL